MSGGSSVTQWIQDLRSGDSYAGSKLWRRYFEQLLRVARGKLGDRNRRVADEEDVVLAVFDAAIQSIQAERFADLHDRNDLWQVLVMLTERKAIDFRRRAEAEFRGNGLVGGDSALRGIGTSASGFGNWDALRGDLPTPEFAVMMVESVEAMLASLKDPKLREVAELRLKGFTDREIAAQAKTSLRTIERRIAMIRAMWSEFAPLDRETPESDFGPASELP